MKRRAAALLLAVWMALSLATLSAAAGRNIYFLAVNDTVLPLSDETMPFWENGYLYIPSTIFAGDVYKELEIGYIPNQSRQLLVLYTAGKSLHFPLGESYAQDTDGNAYYPGAVQRNGIAFVPAALVAEFFGLSYAITNVTGSGAVADEDRGWLVWLRKGSYNLTASQFADAAVPQMRARYDQYLKSKETQSEEVPTVPEETEESFPGKSVYLCIEASDGAQVEAVLDALDAQGARAAFYCTESFFQEEGALLRRMAATGQTIGILADGTDPLDQVRRSNEALYAATCGKTRMVYCKDESGRKALEQAGYCCLAPDLDRSSYGLTGSGAAQTLFQRVSARRGDAAVWLGGNVTAAGTKAFIQKAEQSGDRCRALTETAA